MRAALPSARLSRPRQTRAQPPAPPPRLRADAPHATPIKTRTRSTKITSIKRARRRTTFSSSQTRQQYMRHRQLFRHGTSARPLTTSYACANKHSPHPADGRTANRGKRAAQLPQQLHISQILRRKLPRKTHSRLTQCSTDAEPSNTPRARNKPPPRRPIVENRQIVLYKNALFIKPL